MVFEQLISVIFWRLANIITQILPMNHMSMRVELSAVCHSVSPLLLTESLTQVLAYSLNWDEILQTFESPQLARTSVVVFFLPES